MYKEVHRLDECWILLWVELGGLFRLRVSTLVGKSDPPLWRRKGSNMGITTVGLDMDGRLNESKSTLPQCKLPATSMDQSWPDLSL